MSLTDQLHAPGALLPGKCPLTNRIGAWLVLGIGPGAVVPVVQPARSHWIRGHLNFLLAVFHNQIPKVKVTTQIIPYEYSERTAG